VTETKIIEKTVSKNTKKLAGVAIQGGDGLCYNKARK
jgi:hypothetical protein